MNFVDQMKRYIAICIRDIRSKNLTFIIEFKFHRRQL